MAEIVTRPVEELVPYVGNPRDHGPEQVESMKRSLRKFGWTVPVLVDEGGVLIAGHRRVMAAEQLYANNERIKGLDGKNLPKGHAPVMVAAGWSDAQKRAYVIADNKLHEGSGWDEEKLRAEIEALAADEFDLSTLGFDDGELNRLLAEQGENDPAAEWVGMPEFDQQDKTAFRSITVHFKDQAGVDAFARLIEQPLTDKTRFLWYPSIEIETYADKRYVDEGAAAEAAPAE